MNTSTSPKVQYAYSEMASGANHSRLTGITYPDGRVVHYNYDSGLDSNISRLSSITNSSTTYETYAYLGLSTVVKRVHISGSSTEIGLTYIKQSGENNGDAGDPYIGLDRFDRIVDQRWIASNDVNNPMDRFQYGYDRDSNRLYKDNLLNNSFDELYHANGASAGYDNFNQITDFRRSALSDANSDGVPDTVTTSSRTQNWNFDGLGNWSTLTTDGTAQNRGHNQQNQITSITGLTTPSYDGNGNMVGDQNGLTFVCDAWNRLVQGKNGGTTLVSYGVDALGRRVAETVEGRDFYYSAQWQVLEERVSGTTKVQYLWSPVYVDAMILRDRDADGSGGNGLEERLYAIQDANWNVSSVMNPAGNVQERYVYDPFGAVSYLTSGWSSQSSSSVAWLYLHQAGRFDSAVSLYDFQHRQYSPSLGRWIQVDPIGFSAADLNLFRYVANNPTDSTDPSGLAPDLYISVKEKAHKTGPRGAARFVVQWGVKEGDGFIIQHSVRTVKVWDKNHKEVVNPVNRPMELWEAWYVINGTVFADPERPMGANQDTDAFITDDENPCTTGHINVTGEVKYMVGYKPDPADGWTRTEVATGFLLSTKKEPKGWRDGKGFMSHMMSVTWDAVNGAGMETQVTAYPDDTITSKKDLRPDKFLLPALPKK